jgi:hypothetical protein
MAPSSVVGSFVYGLDYLGFPMLCKWWSLIRSVRIRDGVILLFGCVCCLF